MLILGTLFFQADLEKRISSLETSNAYDALMERETTKVDFKKKRMTTGAGRSAIVYAVKVW